MHPLSPPKPFRSYSDLVNILESRGMVIPDKARAERKLSQIGYYRLSGFWYPCRKIDPSSTRSQPLRLDLFEDGTVFDEVVKLYLFDKKLRFFMMDAIERIEIHTRSVIAHEVGYFSPTAYKDDSFINPRQKSSWTDRNGRSRNSWAEWLVKQNNQIDRSKEDCILWHKNNHKEIPFWVAIEAWDFGLMSKYYEMLNGRYQNKIADRLIGERNPRVLKEWLKEINTLRNRCAHHSRVWNQKNRPIQTINNNYFNSVSLNNLALQRIYGLISIIWFLVKRIGPNSDWISSISNTVDEKPALPCFKYTSMGFPDENGFPKESFGL